MGRHLTRISHQPSAATAKMPGGKCGLTQIILMTLVVGIVTVGCGFASSQDSGSMIREARPVSGITGVELATGGKLFITVGETESLEIEGGENRIPLIRTRVQNGVLKIDGDKSFSLGSREKLQYHLTVKWLNLIKISSSGDVQAPDLEVQKLALIISSSGDLATGALTVPALDIKISSSGDMKITELKGYKLMVNISSSGDLTIGGGAVEEQDIKISSSGDYDAKNLTGKRATVRLSSSGDATIHVSDALNANTSSSGDVFYAGDPEVKKKSTSSGDVQKIAD